MALGGKSPAQSLTSTLWPSTGCGQLPSSGVEELVEEVVVVPVVVLVPLVVEELEDEELDVVELVAVVLELLVLLELEVVELEEVDEEVLVVELVAVLVVLVSEVVVVVDAMHSYCAKYMNSQPPIQVLASSPWNAPLTYASWAFVEAHVVAFTCTMGLQTGFSTQPPHHSLL